MNKNIFGLIIACLSVDAIASYGSLIKDKMEPIANINTSKSQ